MQHYVILGHAVIGIELFFITLRMPEIKASAGGLEELAPLSSYDYF